MFIRKREYDDLKVASKASFARCMDLEKEVFNLRKTIADLDRLVKSKRDQVFDLSNRLEEKTTMINDVIGHLSRANLEVAILKTEGEQKMNEIYKEVQRLEEENVALKANNARLREANGEKDYKILDWYQKNMDMAQKLDTETRRKVQFQAALEFANKRVYTLSDKNLALKKEVDDLVREIDDLKELHVEKPICVPEECKYVKRRNETMRKVVECHRAMREIVGNVVEFDNEFYRDEINPALAKLKGFSATKDRHEPVE